MSYLIERAERFCKIAHAQQVRKYSGKAYWTHPFAVANILRTVTEDENILAAALLHDTVEDTEATHEDIVFFFGDTVAQLVHEVTDQSVLADGNRKVRKEMDRQHIAKASYEGKTIKLADLIHNSISIVSCDKGFAKVYIKEKQALLEILKDGDPTLLERANQNIRDFHNLNRINIYKVNDK